MRAGVNAVDSDPEDDDDDIDEIELGNLRPAKKATRGAGAGDDDYEDEDLSLPPKKHQKHKTRDDDDDMVCNDLDDDQEDLEDGTNDLDVTKQRGRRPKERENSDEIDPV